MKKLLLLLLIGAISFPLAASMWFGSLEYYTSFSYDSQAGLSMKQEIVVNHSGAAGDFFITISGSGGGTPMNRQLQVDSGAALNYQIVNNPTDRYIIQDLSTSPSQNEVLAGNYSSGNNPVTLEYYLVADPGQFAPYGYLTDSFQISLYSGTLSNYELVQSVTIQIATNSPRIANLSVVSQGGSFDETQTQQTLDFGWLSARQERYADIIVQANLPYDLMIQSAGGSMLRRKDQWMAITIPYDCFVDGNVVDLTSGANVSIGSGDFSDPLGDRFELKFVIGDFWDVTEGTFEDIIQITLSAW